MVKRSNELGDWEHTVQRMRTRMLGANVPDLSEADNNAIVAYLASKFGEAQPDDANSRLSRVLMTGKALHYRAVTYGLVNTHAEPHDVAMDPDGNAGVSERAGKIGKLNPKTLEFTEFEDAAWAGAEGSPEPR